MSVINTGKTFSNGEQLSADKLNLMLSGATFDNSAVDLTSTFVDSNGAIIVKDGGVTTAKIADSNVTTAKIANNSVTTAKIADSNVTFAKLADVIDDDTMATASATKLATSESIKAYVDNSFSPSTYTGGESVTLPNGLIMKFGKISETSLPNESTVATVSFGNAFPTAILNVSTTLLTTNTPSAMDNFLGVTSVTKSGFTIQSGSGFVATNTYGAYWQAIGY